MKRRLYDRYSLTFLRSAMVILLAVIQRNDIVLSERYSIQEGFFLQQLLFIINGSMSEVIIHGSSRKITMSTVARILDVLWIHSSLNTFKMIRSQTYKKKMMGLSSIIDIPSESHYSSQHTQIIRNLFFTHVKEHNC